MNKYIIYTDEGVCISPAGREIENFQYLGRSRGKDRQEAIDNLMKTNSWIKAHRYNPGQFMVVQLHETEWV